VIYVDSSVALARLLTEDRTPPATLWQQPLVSSRLLKYEMWNRIHARGAVAYARGRGPGADRADRADRAGARVLARALEPFPVPVCTLDGLHLASMAFLRDRRQSLELASYDDRLLAAARALGIPIHDL
jgi:hypothetical protein